MDFVKNVSQIDIQKAESPYKTCRKQWFVGQKGTLMDAGILKTPYKTCWKWWIPSKRGPGQIPPKVNILIKPVEKRWFLGQKGSRLKYLI